jgi:CRISPR/Cas system-associated endonuclease/helicase Cas3
MSANGQSSVEKDIPELVEDEDKLNEVEDDSKDWDEWHADEDDEESSAKPKCTSCDEVFASTQAVLAHIKEKHNFDIEAFVKASVSDPSQVMYHHIRLVNYLRSLGAQKEIKIAGEDWKSDKWLKSILEDDPLLYDHEYDDEGATGEMNDAPFKLGYEESSPSEAALESFKEMSREEVEKRLRSVLAEKSQMQEKLSYLELHLASLQRLNKNLLEEGTSLEIFYTKYCRLSDLWDLGKACLASTDFFFHPWASS